MLVEKGARGGVCNHPCARGDLSQKKSVFYLALVDVGALLPPLSEPRFLSNVSDLPPPLLVPPCEEATWLAIFFMCASASKDCMTVSNVQILKHAGDYLLKYINMSIEFSCPTRIR